MDPTITFTTYTNGVPSASNTSTVLENTTITLNDSTTPYEVTIRESVDGGDLSFLGRFGTTDGTNLTGLFVRSANRRDFTRKWVMEDGSRHFDLYYELDFDYETLNGDPFLIELHVMSLGFSDVEVFHLSVTIEDVDELPTAIELRHKNDNNIAVTTLIKDETIGTNVTEAEKLADIKNVNDDGILNEVEFDVADSTANINVNVNDYFEIRNIEDSSGTVIRQELWLKGGLSLNYENLPSEFVNGVFTGKLRMKNADALPDGQQAPELTFTFEVKNDELAALDIEDASGQTVTAGEEAFPNLIEGLDPSLDSSYDHLFAYTFEIPASMAEEDTVFTIDIIDLDAGTHGSVYYQILGFDPTLPFELDEDPADDPQENLIVSDALTVGTYVFHMRTDVVYPNPPNGEIRSTIYSKITIEVIVVDNPPTAVELHDENGVVVTAFAEPETTGTNVTEAEKLADIHNVGDDEILNEMEFDVANSGTNINNYFEIRNIEDNNGTLTRQELWLKAGLSLDYENLPTEFVNGVIRGKIHMKNADGLSAGQQPPPPATFTFKVKDQSAALDIEDANGNKVAVAEEDLSGPLAGYGTTDSSYDEFFTYEIKIPASTAKDDTVFSIDITDLDGGTHTSVYNMILENPPLPFELDEDVDGDLEENLVVFDETLTAGTYVLHMRTTVIYTNADPSIIYSKFTIEVTPATAPPPTTPDPNPDTTNPPSEPVSPGAPPPKGEVIHPADATIWEDIIGVQASGHLITEATRIDHELTFTMASQSNPVVFGEEIELKYGKFKIEQNGYWEYTLYDDEDTDDDPTTSTKIADGKRDVNALDGNNDGTNDTLIEEIRFTTNKDTQTTYELDITIDGRTDVTLPTSSFSPTQGVDYTFNGDNENNNLSATGSSDVLHGKKGNDALYGKSGNDTLYGGDGNDVLYGGVGNDTLYGDEGNDVLQGNGGNDTLQGGEGNDVFAFYEGRLVTGESNLNIVLDFNRKHSAEADAERDTDRILVNTYGKNWGAYLVNNNANELESFLSPLGITWARGNYDGSTVTKFVATSPSDEPSASLHPDTIIYRGNTAVMILKGYTDDLTKQDFLFINNKTKTADKLSEIHTLSSITSNQGFKLRDGDTSAGSPSYNHGNGISVGPLGDINGDGISDFLVGSTKMDSSGLTNNGAAYVVFGDMDGYPFTLNLESLDGTNGFRIYGARSQDKLGADGSFIGDINHDGIDDFAVSASSSSSVYFIYGQESTSGFNIPSTGILDLNNITSDHTKGFKVDGATANNDGRFTRFLGDVNGDGYDDALVATPGLNYNNPTSYILLGRDVDAPGETTFPATIGLTDTDMGIIPIKGAVNTVTTSSTAYTRGDGSGRVAASIGDLNDDGYDDFIMGAPWDNKNSKGGDYGNDNSGAAYVVFGDAAIGTPLRDEIALTELNGSNGFTIYGTVVGSFGSSATNTDFNGDGILDIIVSACWANSNGIGRSGSVYIIFGEERDSYQTSYEMSQFNQAGATNLKGVRIDGERAHQNLGYSVWSAGDFDGDGYGDVVASTDVAGGEFYLIFGGNDLPDTIDLATDSSNGRWIEFDGTDTAYNQDNRKVGSVGDLNDDGLSDIILAPAINDSYVIYGQARGIKVSRIRDETSNKYDTLEVDAVGGQNVQYFWKTYEDTDGDGIPNITNIVAATSSERTYKPTESTTMMRVEAVFTGFNGEVASLQTEAFSFTFNDAHNFISEPVVIPDIV